MRIKMDGTYANIQNNKMNSEEHIKLCGGENHREGRKMGKEIIINRVWLF